MSMLQSANGLPDHGSGELGQVAHGALTSPPGQQGLRLFLGYNTLPEPPFPMVGYFRYPLDPQAASLDPADLLRMAADSMRAQPVPRPESFDDAHRRLAATMRVDAMVLVAPARAFSPDRSPSARALLANLIEGYYREGDAAACVDGQDATVALAVDREGGRVLLTAPRDSSGGSAGPARIDGEPGGVLFDLLEDVLDAQYSWTKAAFAL